MNSLIYYVSRHLCRQIANISALTSAKWNILTSTSGNNLIVLVLASANRKLTLCSLTAIKY